MGTPLSDNLVDIALSHNLVGTALSDNLVGTALSDNLVGTTLYDNEKRVGTMLRADMISRTGRNSSMVRVPVREQLKNGYGKILIANMVSRTG